MDKIVKEYILHNTLIIVQDNTCHCVRVTNRINLFYLFIYDPQARIDPSFYGKISTAVSTAQKGVEE